MYVFDTNELLIIKHSTSWASRSLAKLRSYLDSKYGYLIRRVLLKGVGIINELKDMLDNFVSGSTYGKTKTENDYRALSSFITVSNLCNSISLYITSIAIPILEKDGVVISLKEKTDEIKGSDEIKDTDAHMDTDTDVSTDTTVSADKLELTPKKIELLKLLSEYQIAIDTKITVPTTLSDDILLDFKQLLADAGRFLNEAVLFIGLPTTTDKEAEEKFKEASGQFGQLVSAHQVILAKAVNSSDYSSLIKQATTPEEVSSYYLLSLGGYNILLTPIKEKILYIKNFIGFGVDDTIDTLRDNCINYSKELITVSKTFVDTIESSVKNKNKEKQWTDIINAYNKFSTEYNKYRPFFIQLYSALRTKANQDKLIKSKKEMKGKRDTESFSLRDFVEHSWSDMPTMIGSRFPVANQIII